MKREVRIAFTLLLCSIVVLCGATKVDAAKKLKAKISGTQVGVGARLTVSTSVENVVYRSSNSSVASVSREGVVTGKKAGSVKITAKCPGYQNAVFSVKVKAKTRKPSLPVALDEVSLQNVKMEKNPQGEQVYSAVVRNTAKKGTVRRIQYYYEIQALDKENMPVKKTVVLTAQSVKAGKKSARIQCEGDYSGNPAKMNLTKVRMYTGDALYTYTVAGNKTVLQWGTKDKKAPVFSGWVGKQSVYAGEPIRVCYSDRKKTYRFADHVTATDDRDGKVKVSVDASGINWKKNGIYKVKYQAKDKAGNVKKAWASVQVFVAGTPEAIADEVLSSITKKKWSAERKLRAIYNYAHSHCSYVDNGTHKNWRNTAVRGIRYQSGDCFTYYAVSKLLITRAGIPNLTVTRYPASSSHHWWNLVYVRGGWYHFDTTPRQRKGKFCLVTDAQLKMYSTGYTFRYKEEEYPKRAKKKISPNP